MIRRKFLECSGKSLLSLGLASPFSSLAEAAHAAEPQASASSQEALPGTTLLTERGDFAFLMEDGIQRFALRKNQEAPQQRAGLWNWDYSSPANYQQSILPHRERFRHMVGAVDPRTTPGAPELTVAAGESSALAHTRGYSVLPVRWPVFDPVDEGLCGMHAEGLLLQPDRHERARVVALPDADWTPEMLVGMQPGVPAAAQFARRLAENGCQVLVPMLINREDTFSGNPEVAMTNEPHREWIYREAFELGRHIIGYEVQKVLAAIDWFTAQNHQSRLPVGVMGYGEGGLIAFYAAALDSRIDAAVVSGYFQEREIAWQQPIYRDVWNLVREFGDAEVASMIAPRHLIVEACCGPVVNGPPPAIGGRRNVACPNGKLSTPPLDSVQRESERARAIYRSLGVEQKFQLVVNEKGQGQPGSGQALQSLIQALGLGQSLQTPQEPPKLTRPLPDPQVRLHRQLEQMVAFSQGLGKQSPARRAEFWSKADTSSAERWVQSSRPLRDYIWNEILGHVCDPKLPPNPRTRLVYDAPHFRGYQLMLDVWPDVIAYGILLVPRDIRPGERRPVVVCQHGFQGRAEEVADPNIDSQYYHHYGADLADLGFVVFAPQNPFVGYDRFRLPQRVAHPLKLDLYSFIIGQNEQFLGWLAEQPFVDAKRIGFYGVSYGGETAVRVPPLLDAYALSITSANFGALVPRMTSVTSPGFMFDDSYDLYHFNLANVADYSDLANLMLPRPFMVERAHGDGSSTDELVAFEFAAVKHFYNQFGMADRAAIEYFNGGHTVHKKGTFQFLCKFLYPERSASIAHS